MPKYIDTNKIEYFDFDLSILPAVLKNIAHKEDIDKIPTADVEPVRHAYWIRRMRDNRNTYYDVIECPFKCSACRRIVKEETKRCPECGAKMDEKGRKQ